MKSVKSRKSDLYQLCVGVVLLGVAGAASAQSNEAACCQLTTSLAQEALRGKDQPSDERFLNSEGPPPNVHFLVDTSCSMQELVQVSNSDHAAFFAQGEGCTNSSLLALQAAKGWNPAITYPVPDMGTGLGSDTGKPALFQDQAFYAYMSWLDSSAPTVTWTTKEAACAAQHTSGTAAYTSCVQCLATKGFYKKPGSIHDNTSPMNDSRFILWGRFLNFNPPKYVTAKVALKQLLKDMRRVRVGLSQFGTTNGGAMVRPQSPSCDQSLKDANALDSVRGTLISSVDGLRFDKGTPLANSLLNIGQYFSSSNDIYRNVFGFSDYAYPAAYTNASLSTQSRSWCWGCQSSSIIVLTDGEPGTTDTLPPTTLSRLQARNGGPVTCPSFAPCSDAPNYKLDDVAKLLANQDLQQSVPPVIGDLNTAGRQSPRVHVIALGHDSNLLRNTALVGGGLFSRADDVTSLRKAMIDLVVDAGLSSAASRPTSFSTASQTVAQASGAAAVVVPRFTPARKRDTPWQGALYRFSSLPERLAGCDPANPSAGGDLNWDGDCDDTHLVDASGEAVTENDQGQFVKLASPMTPAQPFWEAGQRLKPSGSPGTTRWKARRIFTIFDNNGPYSVPDGKIDRFDQPVHFDEQNVPMLLASLGISQNSAACAALASQLGVASLPPEECARVVIRWYRGADALHPDPLQRGYDRPFLLHDIFHSSPVNVEPPLPKASCGDSSQCLPVLFSGQTPLQADYVVDGQPAPLDAYDYYVAQRGGRDQVVLVGSNGGMLHAFHNGQRTGVDPVSGLGQYDAGSGEELWAFVPPDLLPRLASKVGKHATFVDGTAMVRQVWLDGTGEASAPDGRKQWSEYRTVAVVGTGAGGVHRFALDLTDLLTADLMTSPRVPNQPGTFLWMWPQPCDPLALRVGESFSNFAPHPAPIGPVALSPEADDALHAMAGFGVSGLFAPWTIQGLPARERWVVGLNGGSDAYQSRGRGMALVDIQSGHTVWSFFHGDGSPRSEALRYPIAAGLALADVGHGFSGGVDADSLFDTATVGDFGGQLWTVRFWVPGQWDAARQQVSNWLAARSFRVANLAGRTTDPEALRPPFSTIATNVVQPDTGALRTFVGTGDRQNLADAGPSCRLSNPRGCAELGCQVQNTVTIERGYWSASTSEASFSGYRYAGGTSIANPIPSGSMCGGARARLRWFYSVGASSCPSIPSGEIDFQCLSEPWGLNCREAVNSWSPVAFTQAPLSPQQRFYGIWSYGGDPSRTFNTEPEAAAFDAQHFSDGNLLNAGASQMELPPLSPGWYVPYSASAEQTATAATVVNGCVLWGSFEPRPPAVCGTTGSNVVRLYQAGSVSGRADCAAGFQSPSTGTWSRFLPFGADVTPPEPTVRRVSVPGQPTTTSATLLNPGSVVTVPVSVGP